MRTPMQALDVACAVFGSQQALADALSAAGDRLTSPSITDWRRRQAIPEDRCEPIETLCALRWDLLTSDEQARIPGGPPRVEELAPGVLWRRDGAGRVVGVEKPIKPTPRTGKRARQATERRQGPVNTHGNR